MQEFDTSAHDSDGSFGDERQARIEQMRAYMQFIFKRILVFVCFGPGVLGCLWLIGRILKR